MRDDKKSLQPETPIARPSDPIVTYRERTTRFERARDDARRQARRLSDLRLAAFIAVLLAITWASTDAARRPLALAAIAIAVTAFIALVITHRRVTAAGDWSERLRAVNALGEQRILRAWNQLPDRGFDERDCPPDHPYGWDLDVVGHASLFGLVDTVSAAPGRPTLLRWLLDPPHDAAMIRDRQASVRELVPRRELREELHASARAVGALRADTLEPFLAWAESDGWLLQRKWVLIASWILPVLTLAVIALTVAGVLSGPRWLIPVALSGAFLAYVRGPVYGMLERADARATGLRSHAGMLERVEHERFETPLLERLRGGLTAGGGSPALRRLDRVLTFAESRHAGIFHAPLALLLLWDVHAVAALERWQRDYGRRLRGGLAALGEIEALAALATLASDNPTWSFPAFDEGGTAVFDAKALGHPLIADAARVANDVSVGPPGTLLLVTGSNMSGKSTLLRAIGANAILAQAGGPVCAAQLTMPLLAIEASVRTSDSLERGMSLFMAELQRIKRIVVAARSAAAAAAGTHRPVLYLLDEMLHGTNSAERRIAARVVLGHLLEAGAIGVVTTHDLALASEGALAQAARPVHFTESFRRDESGATMTFDYKLRPGLATSANALKLLELVGLGD